MVNKRKMTAVLFDLDGTLVDSAPDIHAAAQKMLTTLHLPPLALDDAKNYMGDGMTRFIKRAITRQWWGEPNDDLLRNAAQLMDTHYADECTVRRRVYAGTYDALTTLQDRGFTLGCVTNKPMRFTRPVLAACRLDKFFQAVIAGDSLPTKKPDPAPLHEACRLLKTSAPHAWMVGDSIADARAANAAGCRFAVVSYGYHRNGDLPSAEHIIHHFSDTPQMLAG